MGTVVTSRASLALGCECSTRGLQLAVNGRELKGSDEIFRLFDRTAGQAVVLKLGKDSRSSRSAISMALKLMVRGGWPAAILQEIPPA
jgi:hypothetical protein